MKRISVFLVIILLFVFSCSESFAFYTNPPTPEYLDSASQNIFYDLILKELLQEFDNDPTNNLSYEQLEASYDLFKRLSVEEMMKGHLELNFGQHGQFYESADPEIRKMLEDKKKNNEEVIIPIEIPETLVEKIFSDFFLQQMGNDLKDQDFEPVFDVLKSSGSDLFDFMRKNHLNFNTEEPFNKVLIGGVKYPEKDWIHKGKYKILSIFINGNGKKGQIGNIQKEKNGIWISIWYDTNEVKIHNTDYTLFVDEVRPNTLIFPFKDAKDKYDRIVKPKLKKNPYFPGKPGNIVFPFRVPARNVVPDPYDPSKYKILDFKPQSLTIKEWEKKKPQKMDDKFHFIPSEPPPGAAPPSNPNVPKPQLPHFPETGEAPNLPGENPDDPEIPKLDFSPLYVPVPSKFPFCIPFDLANSLQIFKSQTAGDWEPVWVIPWSTAEVEVNLTKFSVLAKIVRYFVFAIFINGLIHATRNLIRG